MDRIQKKCFVGVTVMHALPLLIAVVGTAFFNKEEKIIESPHIIELINPNVTDGPTRGGPQAAMTTATPEAKPVEAIQPKPTPLPEPIREPEPPKETFVEQPKPKPVEPKEDISETPVPTKQPKKTLTRPVEIPKPTEKVATKPAPKRNINISKPIIRNSSDKKAAADAAEKAARDAANRARNQIAAQLKGSVNRLGANLSSTTTVDLQGGSGDGAGAINYGDLVMKKYDDAWIAPNEVDDDVSIAKVRVVIARNGNVVSSEIIKASGNTLLDRSVRRALDSVRFIERFPESSKDSQRTYIINFNLKLKRSIG